MAYKQNNPLSRQKWGGNKDEFHRHMDAEGHMTKSGVVGGGKYGKGGHYKDYEGTSRKSSEEGMSRQKYGGNKGDLRRSAPRDYEAPSRHGSMKGDQSATHVDYAHYKGTDKGYHGHTGASHGDQSATHRDYMIDPRTHSPISNASHYGIQGVNESDWIKYGGDVIDETAQKHEGMSRMSSPLNSDDRWIQDAFDDVKARGTEGVCTGDKFGSSSCPPGSKRYNMAKTLRKMAKNR
tara:strand:+ start:986 stop:1693 length:708 start_codon:yes stop_codon:yes gene_type:complete